MMTEKCQGCPCRLPVCAHQVDASFTPDHPSFWQRSKYESSQVGWPFPESLPPQALKPRPPKPWQPGDDYGAAVPLGINSKIGAKIGDGRTTVVIPTCSRPKLIGRAIRSVLAQTRTDWKLIIAFNGAYPAEDYAKALEGFYGDPRISVVRSPSAGIPEALNAALGDVTTEYMAVLDDDDEWKPEFLEELSAALDASPSAGMAYCDLIEYRGEDQIVQTTGPEEFSLDALKERNWITTPMGMFRVEIIRQTGGFDPRCGFCDWDIWMRCAAVGPVPHVRKPLTIHNWHGSNTSSDSDRMDPWTDYQKGKIAAGAYDPPPADHTPKPRLTIDQLAALKSG
jgi:hypothetical protein